MHYIEYCKRLGMHQASPVAADDFYERLSQIAINRSTVLDEIEWMSIKNQSALYKNMKRCFDILLSCFGLLIGAIPFLGIAIAIKIDSKGPILYRQRRVGKDGEIFQIIKFRTMSRDAERITGPVWSGEQDPRITSVGAFLRKMRFDELPNLFNILKGEMTFVGPRPERPEFVYKFIQYMPAFDRRHDVKPGLAGVAQLMNGYDTSPKSVYRKLRWDAQYMRKMCLMADVCILYRTVMAVLKGKIGNRLEISR